MEPSIKGFGLQPALERVRRLCANGVLKDLDDYPQLEPEDIDIIVTGVSPTFWYPLGVSERVMRLLCDTEGAGDPQYWVRYGRETAGTILSARSVSMLITGARAFGDRAGAALVQIGGLAFNVGKWRYEGAGLRDFTVTVEDAGLLPESTQFTSQGFIEMLAARFVDEEVRCKSSRPTRDRIVFRGRAVSLGAVSLAK